MVEYSDDLKPGDQYEELTLNISDDDNHRFLAALDATNPIYSEIVHPALLFCYCSITRSPSFRLRKNVSAVGAKFGTRFLSTLQVGKSVKISWKVEDRYIRRSRVYQISSVHVEDDEGCEILARSINNTFVGGEHLANRVQWEAETGYSPSTESADTQKPRYEISGPTKQMTLEKMRMYSGGPPGPRWPARNIHTDRELSIRSGIGKPIASGMMLEGYLVDLMLDFLGMNFLTSGSTSVIALQAAGDGDTIIPKAHVSKARQSAMDLEIWCENQSAHRIMIGEANGSWLSKSPQSGSIRKLDAASKIS